MLGTQFLEGSRFECIASTKRQWFGPFDKLRDRMGATGSGTDMRATIFEVIKIELLDLSSNSSILDVKVADSNETDLLSVANILQNVEKSYDKGKLLLEESKKSDAWDAIFRRF